MRLLQKFKSTLGTIIRKIIRFLTSPIIVYFLFEPFFKLRGYRNKNDINYEEFKNILVIKLDEIGDVVLCTPLLRELRRNYRDSRITLVVKPEVENLIELCSYVDEILTYEFKDKSIFSPIKKRLSEFQFSRKYLLYRKYDLAIIPRWDIDYYNATYLAYFSGSRIRISYSENISTSKQKYNKNYDFLLSSTLNNNELKHEVQRNLDILRFIKCKVDNETLELWAAKEDSTLSKEIFCKYNLQNNCLVVALGIGALNNKRKWPINNYIGLCEYLLDKFDINILLLGGSEDRELGDKITSNIKKKIVNLAGKTTLREVYSILKKCNLYIGNDTGLMHIAAAASVPVIEISCHPKNGNKGHENSPMRFGPWGVKNIVLQPDSSLSPCENECSQFSSHCISQISLSKVADSVKQINVL